MPRLRIDQMLNFSWKFLTPLALILLMVTAIVDKLFFLAIPGVQVAEGLIPWVRAGIHLLVNLIILVITIQILKGYQIKSRLVVAQPRPVVMTPESSAPASKQEGVSVYDS